MRRLRTVLFPLLAFLAACSSPRPDAAPQTRQNTAEEHARQVTAIADDYVAAFRQRFPELDTYYPVPGARHDRFTDNAPAARAAWQSTEDALAARLAGVDADLLWERPEWVTYGFLREALEASRGMRVCRSELWTVNQLSGWQVEAATLAALQPVGTPELREQAIARWSTLPRVVDNVIANLREGVRLGYTVPRRNAELVIEQLDALLAMAPADLPFASPAQRDEDPEFRTRWARLVAEQLRPAVERYRDFLRGEYLPAARTTISLADLPDGDRCYAALLRSYTTLDRSPQEVFDIGQRTIAEREARLRELGEKVFGTSGLAEIRQRLRTDRSNDFASRDEAQAVIRETVERARQVVPQWFGRVPKNGVVIEPLPAYQEQGGYSQYIPGSEDGSRPGIYKINLVETEGTPRGLSLSTAFHEAYPGHHLQIALAQERPAAHPITRLLGSAGFAEGWGRYAETLADEMGLYGTDHNRLSHLAGMPTGMVVDPGIHAMGWTREQAIEYSLSKQPSMDRAAAERYVDRIAVIPGQMTTYGVGEVEILALREEARQALGERFDIRELHDRMLENGTVTLGMLRSRIERWIASR